MYANVVSIRYKSMSDRDKALPRIGSVLKEARKVQGFQEFLLVKTADDATVHMAVYASKQDADRAREELFPQLREAVGPFTASPASVTTGEAVHDL